MDPADHQQRVGATLGGKYELISVLGSGGMGVVYEALNTLTGRRVAVKLLGGHVVGADARQRLLREARAAAKIESPHVVQVLDVAMDGADMFLVMELLRGESLENLLARQGRLSAAETADLLGPIARALELAHDQGIVHRDLKPSNIFLHVDSAGRRVPKLVDFGIARADGPSLTSTGMMSGTVGYMAPEQMRDAKRADARADIWALGVVAYECLSGQLPFPGKTPVEMMASVLSNALTPLSQVVPTLAPARGAVIDRALSFDPAQRPQRASDVIAGLHSARDTAAGDAEKVRRHSTLGQVAAAIESPDSAPAASPSAPVRPAATTPAPAQRTPRAQRLLWGGATLLLIGGAAAIWSALAPPARRAARTGAAATAGATTTATAGSAPAPAVPAAAAIASALDQAGAGAADSEVTLPRRRALPRPSLVPIAGGGANLGSSDDEVRDARDQCAEESGAAECPAALFEREAPAARAEVSAFRLAKHEITNRELLDWLTNQGDVRMRARGTTDWLVDAEGPIAALVGPAAPDAGLRVDGGSGDGVLALVPERADHPAVWVSRRSAQRLCHDVGLRLPTAAEWEWAARGPKRRPYPWGQALFHCQRAVAARDAGLACAKLPRGAASVLEPPVADRTPEGVTDLAGNVAEWVADPAPGAWAGAGQECPEGACFAVKGGDWAAPAWRARAAATRAHAATFAAGWLGWRCAGDEH